MKYIVLSVPLGKDLVRELPVIFPDEFVHALVAEAMAKCCAAHNWEGPVRVVSAGHLSSMCIEPATHGESESLGLKARTEDDQLIRMHDYLHGLK